MVLQDGSVYRGYAFGANNEAVGEVVFTTANVGYPESLTDPSYKGQILVFTSPLIGNYGTSPDQWESDAIQVSGAVIFDLTIPSHYTSVMGLDEWFRRESIPGIYRVDTRALTVKLREVGVMMGAIADDVDRALKLIRDALGMTTLTSQGLYRQARPFTMAMMINPVLELLIVVSR